MEEIKPLERGELFNQQSEPGVFKIKCSSIAVSTKCNFKNKKEGILKKILGIEKENLKYDVTAVLLNAKGKIENTGRTIQTGSGRNMEFYNGDIIFYNSIKHPSGTITLTVDNISGGGKIGKEIFTIDLDSLEESYKKIVFIVSVFQGKKPNTNFGSLDFALIKGVDASGREIFEFNVHNDSSFQNKKALTLAEMYRENGHWKIRKLGEPLAADSLKDLLNHYL